MAGTATPIFPQTIKNWATRLMLAQGITTQDLVTGGANGSKVESVIVTNSQGSSRDLQLFMSIGGIDYIIGTVSISGTAGHTNSVNSVSLLGASTLAQQTLTSQTMMPGLCYDERGNKYLYVASGSILKVRVTVAVLTGATNYVDVLAQGGDY